MLKLFAEMRLLYLPLWLWQPYLDGTSKYVIRISGVKFGTGFKRSRSDEKLDSLEEALKTTIIVVVVLSSRTTAGCGM